MASFLTTEQAAELVGVSTQAIRRWIRVGVKDGTVRLWAKKFGGRLKTTQDALDRFAAECALRPSGSQPAPRRREDMTDHERREWTIRTLARHGIVNGRDLRETLQQQAQETDDPHDQNTIDADTSGPVPDTQLPRPELQARPVQPV